MQAPGKTLVINYWAIWCAPCRKEIPELNELARDHAESVIVLGVNFDGSQGEILASEIEKLGIEFDNLPDYQNLPQIFGNIENFKIFFKDLKKVNFPFNQIKRLSLYEAGRWDLETLDNKTIRLPTKNYINSLKNYLSIKNKDNFRKYRIFDYRLNETLILK